MNIAGMARTSSQRPPNAMAPLLDPELSQHPIDKGRRGQGGAAVLGGIAC